MTASDAGAYPPVDCKEDNRLNNNRGSNRRRGRGNNRQQGGNQANRIDSRARGNAPQLLEKYKKLAHDASLNGDRVQAEYYLQFADHYFRVIADTRALKEEQRGPRPSGERDQSYDEDYREDDDQYHRLPREGARENGREGGRDGNRDNNRDGGRDGNRDVGRDARRSHDDRREQFDRDAADRDQGESDDRDSNAGGEASAEVFEPAENPFVRENRSRRTTTERKPRSRREPAKEEAADGLPREDEGQRLDPSLLPPAFSVGDEEQPAKPRRTRARKPRAASGENDGDKGGEELEAVS